MATPPPAPQRVRRTVARLLGGGQGEVRAMQDLQHLEGVFRFILMFGFTSLLPALALSWLAWSSISAEELYVDADVERRTDLAGEQIHTELEDEFGSFERSVRDRLQRDHSVLTGIADLSPFLKAAFRFDASGALTAPFEPPSPADPPGTPRYQRLMDRARRIEASGDAIAAERAWQAALQEAESPADEGTARLGHARAIEHQGRIAEAEESYADVYAEYATVRDPDGFRIGDLAMLALANRADQRDAELGAAVRSDLVDRLLASKWTIGRPGEAAVARRALDGLDGKVDPEWLGRARADLFERTDELYATEGLWDELELLAETQVAAEKSPDGDFTGRYIEHAESGALWVTTWWRGDLYAFAFDTNAIELALDDSALQAGVRDDAVHAAILGPLEAPPAGTLTVRGFNPWLPSISVAVAPADPSLLGATKARRRAVRAAIIAIAVGTSIIGVITTARLLNRELEAARSKADFAANVSHELRSPITQIRLKGEALQLDLVAGDADRQTHYDAIVNESERLSRLVDNVLDFSAIERGMKKYTFRADALDEIAWKAVESQRSDLEAKGFTVELHVDEDLPVVFVDRDALAQVLINLLSNASKYGAEGKWVGVRVYNVPDGVAFAVSDRGMGISAADQRRLFERFYRSSDPRVRRHRGTGIGLTIVQYIVHEHGGTIRVDSAPGRGTSFVITLPLSPPREAGAPA